MQTMSDRLPVPVSAAAGLQERVLLVAPTMGWWRGQYQMPDAVVHLKDIVIDKKRTTKPQIKLFTASEYTLEWEKRFNDLDNERKALVKTFSRTFPIHGVRLIARTAAEEFFNALIGPVDETGDPIRDPGRETQSIAFRLQELAADFIENYDYILQNMSENTQHDVWDYVRPRIPTPRQMRKKFYVDVQPIELYGSGARHVTRGDLQQYNTLIQASTMRLVEAAIEEMVVGPREELAKALADLHDLINRNGRVTESSFNAARAAMNQLRMFSFVADDTMLQRINALSSRLDNTDPSALNSETAAGPNGLLTALAQTRAEIADEQRRNNDIAQFGRELRGLNI